MMTNRLSSIFVGESQIQTPDAHVEGGYVHLLGEEFYCIRHYDQMPPFFMSIVSSSDHWLFISSTGGLTAGRVDAESALFPYTTDDKVAENHTNTGPVACLLVNRIGRTQRWEPFSSFTSGIYQIERNLYKNIAGDKLVFEEINHDLGLTYRYAWRSSGRFGFVRTVWLQNNSDQPCSLALVDGVQNLLPYGATTALQTSFSNLLDAYKRSELDAQTGLGIFTLSATLTDRAEPSESLMATVAWQVGLDNARTLLSNAQLNAFRLGRSIVQESDIKGGRGAYLVHAELALIAGQEISWSVVADVNQDHSQVATLRNLLAKDRSALAQQLEMDIAHGAQELNALVASADGGQLSAEPLTTAHHSANVLFNIMRGGVFVDNGRISKPDLVDFVRVRNRHVLAAHSAFFAALPETCTIDDLYAHAAANGSPDLIRLCYEYLPLTFSRRHGDPSRPWNRFSINLTQPDGSRRLDYQGNWRDIFQNWEPLAWSYPAFVEGMIAKFLNAITADGYNPYRVTRAGIEWEVPEPDNPWANIGYWSDHQIIYLQKLLEFSNHVHPGRLQALLNQRIFSHADVPYRIREYNALLADWYTTIDFDWERERAVGERVRELGTDGKLVADDDGQVLHVSLAEKLLLLVLTKVGNLAPEGGIWMNTQRPEWNDANNALVGKGLSVVTAAYLRRMIVFCRKLFTDEAQTVIILTSEVKRFFEAIYAVLEAHQPQLATGFTASQRRAVMDGLGSAASDYRWQVYRSGFCAEIESVTLAEVQALLALAQAYLDQTLRANRRTDGLFHTYNILRLGEGVAAVDPLYEMLEGQVAILSAGLLDPEQSLAVLHSLRTSRLYRADQHSYILYPDRDLPGFLQKNSIAPDRVADLGLVAALTAANDRTLLVRDENGIYHFNGAFRNARDVAAALQRLHRREELAQLVDADTKIILDLFEETFDHRSFTGRSGTFFAFEGLGSIYWHMVTKLLLAVQENYWWARSSHADAATLKGLAAAYYDVRAGIGFNKTPSVYGAFPTDPYSHTPKGQGAKQPGMTGQVKEEILTRLGELGVRFDAGALLFDPTLLRSQEFMTEPSIFEFVGLDGQRRTLPTPANALAFTLCQTPVMLVRAGRAQIEVVYADGRNAQISGSRLEPALAQHLLRRDGEIAMLVVSIA
jgi:hypothetical protein